MVAIPRTEWPVCSRCHLDAARHQSCEDEAAEGDEQPGEHEGIECRVIPEQREQHHADEHERGFGHPWAKDVGAR